MKNFRFNYELFNEYRSDYGLTQKEIADYVGKDRVDNLNALVEY